MKNWLPFIFAVNKQSSISAGKFNHCSSLCPIDSGIVMAWYSGTGECQDDQSVYLTYLSEDNSSNFLRLGDKTGNPIVWREGNKNWLLWSKFEDDGPMASLAHRWRHCSLWVQEISNDDTIRLIGEPHQIADSSQHLLARINPLVTPTYTILPLYDEVNRECVIFQGQHGNYKETSRFGKTNSIIQPTIWLENNKLNSLSRNFGNSKRRSIYYYFDDYNEKWKFGGLSHFWNLNNSIAVCNYLDHHLVIWNDEDSRYRRNMSIGIIKWKDAVPHPILLERLNIAYGSYPNICVDDKQQIHFSYTNHERTISYHVWNKKVFNQFLRRGRDTFRYGIRRETY